MQRDGLVICDEGNKESSCLAVSPNVVETDGATGCDARLKSCAQWIEMINRMATL